MMIIDNMGPEKKQDVVNHHVQNEIMDEPPPYDGPSAGFRAAQASTSRPISTSAPVYQPIQQQCVNHLSLFSRHDAILGTYLVDPRLPAAIGVNSGYRGRRSRSVDKAHARNVRHAFGSVPGGGDDSDHSDTAKWRRRSSRKPEVNAAFRTRHGPIKVNVGIANSALMTASSVDGQRKARGRVMLSSRHGRIHVNLTEIQLGRSADLDVSTRHGNITVFLPPSFDGSVAFRSRRGASGITFLPHFASRARVVRGSDREMLVSLSSTPATGMPKSTSQAGDDYCVIGTRHGKVVIGIYGLDTEADAIQSGGLAEQLGALVESGAKQLETWLTAGAKALETSLQARRGAADNARQTRARALSNPLRARSEAIMGASSRKA